MSADYSKATLWLDQHQLYGLNNALMVLYALATACLGTALFPGRDNTALLRRAKDLGIEQIAVGDICPLIREGRFKGGKSCAACLNRACENTLAQRLHHLCK